MRPRPKVRSRVFISRVFTAAVRLLVGARGGCAGPSRSRPLYPSAQGPQQTWHRQLTTPFPAINCGQYCSGADKMSLLSDRITLVKHHGSSEKGHWPGEQSCRYHLGGKRV